jgi:tetratricopeptide (TPR) repeat protein
MKRTERRHLKQNEFERITLQALDMLGEKRREITTVVLIVAAVGLVAAVYWAWRQHTQDSAHALLADAMIVAESRVGPPNAATGQPGLTFPTERERTQAAVTKFKAAADAYPSTDAGQFARYQEAALQLSLGNAAESIKTYQVLADSAGDALYGQMARLGLAEAYARSGQYEQSITAFKELAQRKDGQLPVDGILMQLGRTYRDAGKIADAQQTFNRIIEEFPDSPFNADAKRELEALKKSAA